MKDIEGLDDIKLFVDEFYQKVRDDDFIGPIFMNAIADWGPHLQKMYAFWNAALFGVPGFRGNPFAKHAPLGIQPPHFDRWLQLFDETINHNFEGIMAEDAKNRAQMMAVMFMKRLAALGGDAHKVVY
ncbi:globin [Pelobium manganitolerans]|uniref:Globin n=1 Tax=Pelobium manganitolerans TaxID=1842495 RepID=A0A419S5L8_9SPHI|nr:group III truncated hemoglobin [Pelobium manganitolerans]RKD16148.1 globin [Pelobium manganitolerans]